MGSNARFISTLADTHGLITRPSARIRACSEGQGWQSAFVSAQSEAPFEHDCPALNDPLIVVHLSGPVWVERRLGAHWERRVLPPGGTFIAPGGVSFGVRLGGSLETIHMYLRRDVVEDVAREFKLSAASLLPSFGEPDPFLEQIAIAFRNTLSAPSQVGTLYVDHLARAAGARLVYAYAGESRPPRGPEVERPDTRAIDRAVAYLHENLDRDPSLDELAAVSGLSPGHFSRQFKRATGRPPHQYLLQLRIDNAKRLLASTSYPVAAIALDCGFCNQEHLTRVFRKRTGVTPAVYRRSLS